ncbi:phenylacetic acid degradation operon negative regulatory protein PaaX [Numidum massiliense]|uniref:phenylacetic acid degradation operon negative regulatory protein PaaX n=1 Tax=Numidum massiliense TaxID=1522315 RepID=UPI0006D534B7|nr:phenylacetic acid degradation operon negative regulatory protein PaaX [Numidum massiliense]
MPAKSLNTRSMIFTLYGDYIRHYGNEIWVGSLIRLLEPFGHNEQSVRAAVSRMSKQGWIAARREGNKSYYYLTDIGVKRIDEAGKRIFKLRPTHWDGKWRMLIYTIPEEKRHIRDELRQELVWSGFGMLESSIWITPNALEKETQAIIDRYEIEPYVHFFQAAYNGPLSNEQLVQSCWNIDDISARYNAFIQAYSKKYVVDKEKLKNHVMSDEDCFVERTKLVHEYRKFLFVDPGLPEELLPEEWMGKHAAALFADYYRLLAGPANRFFEKTFASENDLSHRSEAYDELDHPYMV